MRSLLGLSSTPSSFLPATPRGHSFPKWLICMLASQPLHLLATRLSASPHPISFLHFLSHTLISFLVAVPQEGWCSCLGCPFLVARAEPSCCSHASHSYRKEEGGLGATVLHALCSRVSQFLGSQGSAKQPH